MAEQLRRAARHYEVHEFDEGPLRLDLGLRACCGTYEEAVEAALAYLEHNDPFREGNVAALEIVRLEGGKREQVWGYSAAVSAASARDLVRHWGFDVTRPWQGPPQVDPA